MAQVPRLTPPNGLGPACRFQNTPELGRRTRGRGSCSGVSVSVLATLRDLVTLCCWGTAALTSLFIKTNLDVLENNLQGAVAQEAGGEVAPEAGNQPPQPRKPSRSSRAPRRAQEDPTWEPRSLQSSHHQPAVWLGHVT